LDSGEARFLHRSRELSHPGVAPADRDPCVKASNGRAELIPGVHAGQVAGVGDRPGLCLGRQRLLDAAAEDSDGLRATMTAHETSGGQVSVSAAPTAHRCRWVPVMPSSSLPWRRLGLGVTVQARPVHRSMRVRLTPVDGE
jgi:hypothetical protein